MAVQKVDGYWRIDVRYRKARYRKKSPVNTQLGAQRFERSFIESLERQRILNIRDPFDLDPDVRYESYVQAWFNAYVKANTRIATQIGYESAIRRALIPFFGGTRLGDITTLAVEAFKMSQLEDGISRKTVNNRLAVLRRSLVCAVDWGILTHVPRVKLLSTMPPRYAHFTREESAALLDATTRADWRRLFLCGLRTGMRTCELLALRWDDVDLFARTIHVRRSLVAGVEGPPKNGRERILPISSDLHAALLEIHHRKGYVFSDAGDQPIKWHAAYKALQEARAKAGIHRQAGLHALRHSFATQLADQGASITTIQALLGHGTVNVTQRYVHPGAATMREAVHGLEVLCA